MSSSATQNSGGIANLKSWKPGQTGNAGGRPKGLARLARERCGTDGAKLVEFMVSVLENPDERTETRIKAVEWLADRGFGHAVDLQPLAEEDPLGIVEHRDTFVGRLQSVTPSDDQSGEGEPLAPAATPRR